MNGKIRSEMVFVTPELASNFLTFNEQNRRVRPGWVNYLAYTIKSGEWMATHQGLAFSSSGRLLDGQHRLMAIIKADIPVNIMVTYGLSDDAFSKIDNGIRRTNEDLTRLPRRLVEVTRFFLNLIKFEEDKYFTGKLRATRFTPAQIVSYAEIIVIFYEFFIKKCPTCTKLFSSVPVVAAAIYNLMIGESPDYVGDIYRQLILGETQTMPPICLSAVRQVLTGKVSTKGGSDTQLDNFVRFISVFKESNKNNMKLIIRERKTVLNEVNQNLKSWFSIELKTKVNPEMENIKLNIIHRCAA